MSIEQRLDVDIVWSTIKPQVENGTHLIVYHQEEHGAATTLAGKALIGDREPIARIYSKHLNTTSVNFIPVPFWPEYRLYDVRNNKGKRFFILRIPTAYPIELSQDRYANREVWMHTYPVVRDIVMTLNELGVNKMSYMTTNLFVLHKDFKDYSKVAHGEVVSYNWFTMDNEVTIHNGNSTIQDEELDYILAPNVWIWCDVFCNFTPFPLKKSEVLLGSASTEPIDMDTADALLNHILLTYDLSCDESALSEITQKLADMDNIKNFGGLDI
jgi:hypothetical protein